MSLVFNVPINGVSFGQVSIALLRTLYKTNKNVILFPIGGSLDFTSNTDLESEIRDWIVSCSANSLINHDRNYKAFKLWHLSGALESFSKEQNLLSFYELDSPTKVEINAAKNNNIVFFSSRYAVDLFTSCGCKNIKYLPLFFDAYSFKTKDKKYYSDDRIVFNVVGKLEKRKHHAKIIKSWIKKYGNNRKYYLQCAIYNTFLKPEDQNRAISEIIEGSLPFNVQFLPQMPTNEMYNDFLNSGDIVIGMSGGEGWGLPEFHSVAMGKHAVILNAHAYKDWANEKNAVLIEPNGKIEAYDNFFFKKGLVVNQGNIFDFSEDDFINGCEKAINRVNSEKKNKSGLILQDEFSIDKFVKNVTDSL